MKAVYSWIRSAPATSFSQASSALPMPPTPMIGMRPCKAAYRRRITRVESVRSGRPLRPPVSRARGSCSRPGRAMVGVGGQGGGRCLVLQGAQAGGVGRGDVQGHVIGVRIHGAQAGEIVVDRLRIRRDFVLAGGAADEATARPGPSF